MLKFLSFSLCLLLTANSYGQTKQDKQLIKNVDQLITEKYSSVAPGCAVLIAKDGQVIFKKAFGIANRELNVPMQTDMVFRIGSMTKQYTAIAILQLVEKGKISLQDNIQKFIKVSSDKWQNITIENLLTHTSGIIGYDALDFHIPNAIRIDFAPKQFIDSLVKLPLEFTPSTKFNYSNSNYLLLGYIIEQVSGKSYKDYLQENIFKPTGLTNTYYDSPTEIISNRISGYTKDSSAFHNADYISMTQAFSAGALLSNVDDLFKWQQALNSYKLVKKETLDKAFSPYKLTNGQFSDYGYGWFIKDWKGSKSIGHGGAIDGFRSMETFFPDQNIFIATLFNSDNDEYFSLFENITNLVIGKSFQTSYKDLKVSDTILNSYVGIYKFPEDSTQFLKIYKKDNRLFAELSNGSGNNMTLLAQSETLFYLPDVRRIPTTVEFIKTNGKVTGIYWTQEQKHEGKKTE
ncbi:MAG: beta-lactamase family protein [Sphingobacteriales bacterium]|nr:beta-lactamase family protein [Sphingobacteriales bacterium]MBI3717282.1 beta-lactamase family protein [Sphingobacteriales bacterium]